MYIGVISMRYAKALLAYADEKGTEDTVYEEAGILADSFSRIPELRQALDNPVLPAETKLKLICEAAGGGKVERRIETLCGIGTGGKKREILAVYDYVIH